MGYSERRTVKSYSKANLGITYAESLFAGYLNNDFERLFRFYSFNMICE